MAMPTQAVPTKRRLLPVLLTVVLLVVGLAAPAFARATTTEVSATMTLAIPFEDIESEREWVSGPILHLRGAALTWAFDGDLAGTIDSVHNTNLNLATGRGTGFGSMSISTHDVTWEGRYRGEYTDALFAGTFVAHGSDGTMMRGTVTALPPEDPDALPMAEFRGVILERPGR